MYTIETMIAAFAVGSIVTSYVNYYILDLKDESFILPIPIMYVLLLLMLATK